MSRATAVYLVMFVMLVVGLWVILRIGNRLRPPEDLAGTWELRAAAGGAAKELVIGQSGRFFDVAMPGGSVVRMKMSRQEVDEEGKVSMTISSENVAIAASGEAGGEEFRFQVSGAGAGTVVGPFDAHRVARPYAGLSHGRPRASSRPAAGAHAR